MSLIDANHAIEAFLDAIGEAEAMAAGGGQVGVEFDYPGGKAPSIARSALAQTIHDGRA